MNLQKRNSWQAIVRAPVEGDERQEARLYRHLVRFCTDRSGATAIEYGLIAAGISVAIIVAVNTIGTNLNTTFSSVSSQLK
jgi:pilus assembly protein Flp/PilA